MTLRKFAFVFVFLCLFGVPAFAQTRLTEQSDESTIRQFVFDALAQGSGNFSLSEYTHVQKLRISETDKKGVRKNRLSTVKEAFVPSRLKRGNRVRWVYVLIEKDGKPVPANEIEKERIKAGERLMKEEEELQKTPMTPAETERLAKLPPPRGIYFSISSGGMFSTRITYSVRTTMAFCDFRNPQFETLNGRRTVRFDFVPRSHEPWPEDEAYGKELVGQAWFDVEEAMLAKLEGWPLGIAKPAAPYVFYESIRQADGQWLPRLIAMNTDKRKDFFQREFGDVVVEFTDYQRFGTETKDVKINTPQKP